MQDPRPFPIVGCGGIGICLPATDMNWRNNSVIIECLCLECDFTLLFPTPLWPNILTQM